MHEAYCPECRTRRGMLNLEEEVMKNGRRIMKGRCTACNTSIVKVLRQKHKWHTMAH
ncbi:MAG: DUF5679 domain-containing protein [Verrucomicrobiota bacterium]|jgi:hypothetical protein|nr:DUF5679 domain-containing protein [Verrucomicrobiota bacterium]